MDSKVRVALDMLEAAGYKTRHLTRTDEIRIEFRVGEYGAALTMPIDFFKEDGCVEHIVQNINRKLVEAGDWGLQSDMTEQTFLQVTLDEYDGVPRVIHKGKEMSGLVNVLLDWTTRDSERNNLPHIKLVRVEKTDKGLHPHTKTVEYADIWKEEL